MEDEIRLRLVTGEIQTCERYGAYVNLHRAVLERAILDVVKPQEGRKPRFMAILWFLTNRWEEYDSRISLLDCLEVIDLSEMDIPILVKEVFRLGRVTVEEALEVAAYAVREWAEDVNLNLLYQCCWSEL